MTTSHAAQRPLPTVLHAAERLTHLGFVLLSPFPPGAADSELLVSIRAEPTLRHFDIEMVRYWRTGDDRRGHAQELSLGSPMPVSHDYAWGKIEVIDRFGVENNFVTLGGMVEADRVTEDEVVAVFRSPAPILRVGGHSQAADQVALELAAFFGRLMVPIDFDPGAEQAVAAADPLSRYAAFVAFERERYLGHALLRQEHPRQAEILWGEAERLRSARRAAWEQGRRLLDRLGLHG